MSRLACLLALAMAACSGGYDAPGTSPDSGVDVDGCAEHPSCAYADCSACEGVTALGCGAIYCGQLCGCNESDGGVK